MDIEIPEEMLAAHQDAINRTDPWDYAKMRHCMQKQADLAVFAVAKWMEEKHEHEMTVDSEWGTGHRESCELCTLKTFDDWQTLARKILGGEK